MKKVGICGHYGGKRTFLDGQTVKTKTFTNELIRIYGKDNVLMVDTYGGIKKIFLHLTRVFNMTSKCQNIIILPAHNGIRIFAPFLVFINHIFKRRLHYIVIGGWLPRLVHSKKHLKKCLKQFDYIYVETFSMKKALEEQGFENIVILPNCKKLKVLEYDELVHNKEEPYRLCTFSRVTEKKGIEDAIEAINVANSKLGRTVFTLDIFGQIDPEYKEKFEDILNKSPNYIKYQGSVDYNQSVNVLKNYYALVFPTKFFTEGIPGTIIDAYASGLPVISSKWESFNDVIDDNIVGKGYTFDDISELINILYDIESNPGNLIKMKKNCITKAFEFDVSNVGKILKDKLNR